MELIKSKWEIKDIDEFQAYLLSFEDSTRKAWATNILQTKLPVLCMKTADIKYIVESIYKGNYLSFLDLMIFDFYENTAINGLLINKITDCETHIKYLRRYSELAENWATCDLLKFNIIDHEETYFKLSLEFIKHQSPFVKRIGIYILFNYIENDDYLPKVYDVLNSFTIKDDYYVNMMNAWLLSELYIKRKDQTIAYFSRSSLNKTAFNKGIQKIRDSRRISDEEKASLLKYKK